MVSIETLRVLFRNAALAFLAYRKPKCSILIRWNADLIFAWFVGTISLGKRVSVKVGRAQAKDARSPLDNWKYRAFLSYSRNDDTIANWLQKSLEAYVLPKELRDRSDVISSAKHWCTPIFRDRTDLSSGGDLVEKLEQALRDSQFLILLCSPASAASPIVNAEVELFVREGRLDHVFPIIVSGEPYSSDPQKECIPPALRSHNIIAADMRDFVFKNGKRVGDGKDGAKFKLLAGLLDVPLDKLLQRERQKANRRLAIQTGLSGMFFVLFIVATGAAWWAYNSEQEAKRQRTTAEASSEFLIDMFESGIPRRQNPNDVTARMILDRGAKRINSEFADQPELKATLVRTISHAYLDLGANDAGIELLEGSDVSDLNSGKDGAHAQVLLARLYLRELRFDDAEAATHEAFEMLNSLPNAHLNIDGFAWETLGLIDSGKGDLEEALLDFEKAIETYELVSTENPELLAAPFSNRATILSDLGRFEDAKTDLLRARELIKNGKRQNRLSLARINYSLALNSYNSGAYDEGMAFVSKALTSFQELLEPDNPIFADVYTLKGELEFEKGNTSAARQSLLEALEIYTEISRESTPDMGPTYYYLALVNLTDQNMDEALQNVEDAEVAFRAHPAPDEFNLASLQTLRAEILAGVGRSAEAVETCNDALPIMSAILGNETEDYQYYADLCAGLASSE